MAFTTEEEAKLRTIIGAFDNGKTIEQLGILTSLTGGEMLEVMKGGASYKATTAMLQASLPDQSGIYPDVPLNRVTIKRFVAQTSTQVVIDDNLGLIDKLKAECYPCVIGRNSLLITRLNGNDMTKTTDGLNAVLDDWTMPVMVRMGGFWYKYEYDAINNCKLFHFSPYKVRGYSYKRRRFLNCFGGTVLNVDGINYLLSNSNQWTTQNTSIINYHAYAKNLGSNFREIALQDREIYRFYFWLMEQTTNSQSVLNGITSVNSTNWSTFNQSANGGQSTYGQFHKTGETLSILGHKGEKQITVTGFPNGDINVNPYKWLWRENMLSGPYWIRETGYLKKAGIWYKVDDLANIDFSITSHYKSICEDVSGTATEGYILEDFEDTLIPSLLGASSTTGHSDYYWRPAVPQPEGDVYIPVGVGHASAGVNLGVSCLNSNSVPSFAYAYHGGALASDDPTDEIAEGAIAA